MDFLLVKERLENDDFVPRFDKSHECTETSLIRPSGNCNFSIWIDIPVEQRRVGICYCLF